MRNIAHELYKMPELGRTFLSEIEMNDVLRRRKRQLEMTTSFVDGDSGLAAVPFFGKSDDVKLLKVNDGQVSETNDTFYFVHPLMLAGHPEYGKPEGYKRGTPTASTRTIEISNPYGENYYVKLSLEALDIKKLHGSSDLPRNIARKFLGLPTMCIKSLSEDTIKRTLKTSNKLEYVLNDGDNFAYQREIRGIVDPFGRASIIREKVPFPYVKKSRIILPFFSFFSNVEDYDRILLEDISNIRGNSISELAASLAKKYVDIWTFLSLEKNYILSSPHPQNALIEIGPDFEIGRIVLRDLKDVYSDEDFSNFCFSADDMRGGVRTKDYLEKIYKLNNVWRNLFGLNQFYKNVEYTDEDKNTRLHGMYLSLDMFFRETVNPIIEAVYRSTGSLEEGEKTRREIIMHFWDRVAEAAKKKGLSGNCDNFKEEYIRITGNGSQPRVMPYKLSNNYKADMYFFGKIRDCFI